MNNFKKYSLPVGAVLAILLVWGVFGGESENSSEIFATVQEGPFEVIVTTTGELRAKNSTKILGPRNARDIRIFQLGIQNLVPEGTIVQKGDFVAELDRSEITTRMQDAQLQVQQAESQFEQAKLDSSLTLSQARFNLEALEYQLEERELAVEQSAYESPSVQRQAQIQLEQTRRQLLQEKENYVTRVKQQEARIRELETELIEEQRDYERVRNLLNEFTIYAPENGMVIYARSFGGQKVTVGSNVSAFDPVIAELPDFSVMESLTYINEVDIQKVKVGQTVAIGLDAIPEKRLTGVVTSVANIGEQRQNSDSKVFEVVIVMNESDSTLRPSMTTSNQISVEKFDNVIYAPLETVFESDSTKVVYKDSPLGLVKQQVILGSFNENDVVIREGVEFGDRLLMSIPTQQIQLTPLSDEILEKYRKEEEERKRLEAERIQRAQEAASQRPQGGQMRMNFDFSNMTQEQRDSLRNVFRQRMGGQQGGQGGPGGQSGIQGGQRGGQGGAQGRQQGAGTSGEIRIIQQPS